MNPLTSAFLVGLIVVSGRWAQKKEVTINIAVGVMVFAIALAIVNQVNETLARALGMLALVAAAMLPPDGINGSQEPYIISIAKGLGWSK